MHEGAGSDTLRAGIWHQPNGATPATRGNTVLAGHRLEGAFLLLGRLDAGDEIVVFWKRTRHIYAVTEVKTALPDDDAVLRCGRTARLTLYTCVPRHSGDKRVVVVAAPVDGPETGP
ncbi:MAG: sortase [Actinobacteria bacterium]|nr:sortase [Actinomycetota bacterium]